MSFLAPLYALGLLAVAAPIWFHLIRRRPKGQVPFSTLMFLTDSPPPPAQKRRIDQWLLLALRVAALAFLGFAFMRPFLRQETTAEASEPGRRTLILIDTSASMRRGEVWSKAVAQADEALANCRPNDRVALWTFDRTARPVFSFDEGDQLDPGQRLAVARARLKELTPGWGGTELGRGLLDGVGAVLNSPIAGGSKAGKIVLVSDLPQGAKLTGLDAFEWPADVELELRTVTDDRGNAGLSLLADRPDAEKGPEAAQLRVRVVNDSSSKQEQYRLAWAGTSGTDIEAYVPPGESRVVKVPRPSIELNAPVLRLTGDAHDFDNSIFLAPTRREEQTVFFIGNDEANDPAGLRYFLERAWGETPERVIKVRAVKPGEPLTANDLRFSPLVVIHNSPPAEMLPALEKHLRDGGTVLAVLTQTGPVKTLAELTGAPASDITEAPSERYAMWKDIAFDHPLFAPLSGPQFGDFTKVHFWKHRRLTDKQFGEARILARFDNGDPAVLEKPVGRGRLMALASGWQPVDSQLARSSKFVPLMTALVELRGGRRPTETNLHVRDRAGLSSEEILTGAVVRTPNGQAVTLAAGATHFDGTDQPGVYAVESSAGVRSFAVNLDPAESLTTPLPAETLEQLGCRIAKRDQDERRREHDRQQRDVELERTQSIWRGLIIAAIIVLLVETALAGARNRPAPREVGTS